MAAWVNIAVSHIVCTQDPTLFGSCWVQRCAFKKPSHEGEAVLPDVGLPSEGVEDRIGTAADEGQSRGHCTTGFMNMFQPADEQSGLDLSYNYIMGLYCMFENTIFFASLDYEILSILKDVLLKIPWQNNYKETQYSHKRQNN